MTHSYKLLHCADLHLDSPLRGLETDPDAPAAAIRGATRRALANLVDFAIAQQVKLVLIAGDIYDGDLPDSRAGLFLIQELVRLGQAGIHVVAVSGNHDAEQVMTSKLPWPKTATMLPADRAATAPFPDLKLYVHGRGFPTKSNPENPLQDFPRPAADGLNIGLLHTSATDQGGYAPCSIAQLKQLNYDYWALGHIHKRRELSTGRPWIVFPGNLQGRHINEDEPKGATLITVTDGAITDVTHHTLDVVRWARIEADVTGTEDEEQALAAIRLAIADALAAAAPRLLAARLRVSGRTGAHAALVRDASETRVKIRAEAMALATANALWLEEVRLQTQPLAQRAAASPMEASLLARLGAPPSDAVTAAMQEWAAGLLDKVLPLRKALAPEHPALAAATGAIDEGVLAEARALVAARLGAE
jgi:DNA repair exonuclease SbcCD nuclease subunit